MKLEKVYGVILKERLRESEKRNAVSIETLGDKTAVILPHLAFLLPECLLDRSKFPESRMAKRLFEEADAGYQAAEQIGAARKVKLPVSGSKLLRELKNGEVKVRVQSSYLQYFDHPEYQIKGPHKPVFVYEEGEICGLILPVRCPDEDWEAGEWR